MPHSCAFGCKATDVVMHVFPNPNKYPERFKLWVNLVGGNLDTLSENDIYVKKRICDIHFTDEHRNRNKRLNALAVPSLHLPSNNKHTHSHKLLPLQLLGKKLLLYYNVDKCFFFFSGERHCISASANVLVDHNYSVISRPRPKRPIKGASGTYFWGLNTASPLQKKIRYLKTEIHRLRKRGQSHKDVLNNYFINTTFNILIYSWCRNVNRILSGKLKYDGDDDETKLAAHNYYKKHKNYKNRK
ncbi:hypothetical protein ABMA28_015879 [Loxostege sticticalis]|uniref:THAP-type domain-containing protein n=1 Tax=Loxostege sticticalis TaxID=481309 RepID=A0ABD0TC61_LOXSC